MAPPPPPSTPAPHRFLASKRPATQRAETPNLPQGGGGAQQFQATPRFSLHSTPRDAAAPPLLSLTPAARQSAFRRQRDPDVISDATDSSPPGPHPPTSHVHDSIEDSSLLASSAVLADDDELLADASDPDTAAPSPKRRRLVASPILDPTSSVPEESLADYERGPEDYHDDDDNIVSDLPELPDLTSEHQPTFRKAPRFMPVEQPELSGREPLPDVFSPRRRGTRYIPGGLAAELRDWLVDIEAATGPKKEDDFLTKITIDEIRRGTGMVLVTGRAVLEEGSPHEEGDANPSVRMLLAGEGRLVGLARKPEVVVGSVLGIAKPVWDVNLGTEGWWRVACDWLVLKSPTIRLDDSAVCY